MYHYITSIAAITATKPHSPAECILYIHVLMCIDALYIHTCTYCTRSSRNYIVYIHFTVLSAVEV